MIEEFGLDKVQNANYEILCEIDRVCSQNNIRYYLHGGTLLGALRHRGFIPWDDDVDIALPRKDYEQFVAAFCKDAPGKYKIVDPADHSQFHLFLPKVVDTSVTLRMQDYNEEFYGDTYAHPSVDLFIFDEAGKDLPLRLRKLQFIYGLALGHRPEIDHSNHKGIYKLPGYILPVIGKLIPMRTLSRLYNKIAVKNAPDNAKDYYIAVEQPHPKYWGLRYNKNWYEGDRYEPIRDRNFRCPTEAEKEMEMIYGDYMKLPPEEDRIPQHFQIVTKKND